MTPYLSPRDRPTPSASVFATTTLDYNCQIGKVRDTTARPTDGKASASCSYTGATPSSAVYVPICGFTTTYSSCNAHTILLNQLNAKLLHRKDIRSKANPISSINDLIDTELTILPKQAYFHLHTKPCSAHLPDRWT